MNILEKSKALAKLMGWGLGTTIGGDTVIASGHPKAERESWIALRPYATDADGLAQFAAILLKHPEVMEEFVCTSSHTDERATTSERYEKYGGDYQGYLATDRPVTQETLLDAVLKMKGVI